MEFDIKHLKIDDDNGDVVLDMLGNKIVLQLEEAQDVYERLGAAIKRARGAE